MVFCASAWYRDVWACQPVVLSTGRGRGVVATQQLQAGDLLMVLEPLGSMLTGPVGQELQPSDLEQHLNQQTLTQGDRYDCCTHSIPAGVSGI